MCELKVVLNGKEIFYECIYAKTIDGKVLLKDVLGSVKEFPNCYIEEVNIGRKTLMLKSVEDQPRSLVGRIRIKYLRQISQILREHPKGLTITEVSKKLNINKNSVSTYLGFMLQIGLVELRSVGIVKMYFAAE